MKAALEMFLPPVPARRACLGSLFAVMMGSAFAAPLKVFILAGQSNMQGHAKVETFDYMGDDPATAPLLKEMRGSDGKPVVCEGAWISYLTSGPSKDGECSGKLTTGFGARRDPAVSDDKIGPEFTFGITMDQAFKEPVLIIKTAWGGKSLFQDFRPPGAGPFPRTSQDIKKNRNLPVDTGKYYRLMVEHVKKVLGNVKKVCPECNPAQGYEIAGFVWLQGFNDMVDRNAYPVLPKGAAGNRFANYSVCMAQFIRDVRKDLGAPKMPFVIGVLGVDGKEANPDNLQFREAMAAPASLPEFKGNVVAVRTSPFWDERLGALKKKKPEDLTPEETALLKRGASNAGYHYLGCAKTFALMGRAFAKALLEMKP